MEFGQVLFSCIQSELENMMNFWVRTIHLRPLKSAFMNRNLTVNCANFTPSSNIPLLDAFLPIPPVVSGQIPSDDDESLIAGCVSLRVYPLPPVK